MQNLNRIVTQRVRLQGYLPFADHPAGLGQFRDQMWSWLEAGQLRPLQTSWDGLEHVPQVIEDLFAGGLTGKPLIRL